MLVAVKFDSTEVAIGDLPLTLVAAVAIACDMRMTELVERAADHPIAGPYLVRSVASHVGVDADGWTFAQYLSALVTDD